MNTDLSSKILFSKMWENYAKVNPQADEIKLLLGNFDNDHIALRTFDSYLVNIEQMSQVFKNLGYEEKGEYTFEKKKLVAKHYEKPGFPKVFISQIMTGELSQKANNVVSRCLLEFNKETHSMHDLLIGDVVPWQPISYKEYLDLKEESEYCAWLCAFGFRVNHFTVDVNSLKNINSLSDLNLLLKKHGFILNSSGGEIKGSREQGLMQSSTMASRVKVNFSDGEYEIPCCYYEFAERFNDFSGFIAGSADKIFESTDNK